MALGQNELDWAESHSTPRINPHRSMHKPETPAQYIQLLQKYLKIAPFIVPDSPRNTLSHPDLHLDNIFVDPESNTITNIIDWQSAVITPLDLQDSQPQMLELSLNPLNEEQRRQEHDLLDYYQEAAKAAGLSRKPQDLHLAVRLNPLTQVPGCWELQDTFSLRQSLISVVAHWGRLYPHHTPCPIGFTSEELQDHDRESELIDGIAGIVRQLDEQGLIPMGGMVPSEHYEYARRISDYFKQQFMDLAENDTQRILHEAAWPYQ